MWTVTIIQKNNSVRIGFNHMTDAIEYASTSLECGDNGTEVSIKEEEE